MIIKGYASTPDIDRVRDVVPPSAFDESIARKGLNGPKGIKLLWQHSSSHPLGPITKLEKRNNGLWIEAEVDENISWGKDASAVLASVGPMSFSIGYRILDADVGRDADGEYLILTKLDLSEVSVVTFPCNDEAVMTFAGAKADPLDELADSLARLKQTLNPDPLQRAVELAGQLKRITQ